MNNPKLILKQQIRSSFDYIRQIIDLIDTDQETLHYSPSDETRTTAEIILHILRSYQYYITGVSNNTWEAVPYTIDQYNTVSKISGLIDQVDNSVDSMISSIDGDQLHHLYSNLEKPAFGLNLIIELLYHQSQHIGQIQTYLRLNNITPPVFDFII